MTTTASLPPVPPRRGVGSDEGASDAIDANASDTAATATSDIPSADWQAVLRAEPAEAAAWMEAAASLGHARAQAALGQWLLDGRGVARDPAAALHWFLRAAQLGEVMAMNMAGRCHEQGWGTAVDLVKAAGWYAQAARLGLPHAQYNLANLLAAGQGIDVDHARAFHLYRQAADQGYAKAYAKLGRYHEDGLVVPRDPVAARDCYRRGAEGGDFRGQFCFAGVLAAEGREDEALHWLAQVAETATPAYLRQAGALLQQSPQPRIRAVGDVMRARAAA